jgi:RimJ/RimL family protein N-acetyltransferase
VAIAAGYVREGVQRGAAPTRTGNRHDLIVWARLAGDPPGPSHRALPDLPGGFLTDDVVALHRLAPRDAQALHALNRVADVQASSYRSEPVDPATIARICAHAEANWLAGIGAHLVVVDAATGEFTGDIGLFNLSPIGEGMIGYSLLPAWRGRGYATRAVRLLSAWALGPAGLARIVAGTDPANSASQRVLDRAGFSREGYQRGHLPTTGGSRADVVSYALLATDLTDYR